MSSARIGFCAWQIVHHEAWMATKIGLPAFWASANAASLNGWGPAANAGVGVAALAATAAKKTERPDRLGNSLFGSWGRNRDTRGTQAITFTKLSDKSNFVTWV